ncbi:hypothetical protein GCM10009678_69140 [Actinomadura kijaniata]|uniref:Uncharacterized protein n=1 Tax=Actinomadura namibiensis TaxID=182080 RepID=A0A7W3QMT2_ACTNM|nr:hypothetical protein [Actinomadura namibiensis]MBA8952348.1 hypothetical protein [Actinomadura namibiensis]
MTAGSSPSHGGGAVEGTVNKIKFLKGQMFGRADLDLSRIEYSTTADPYITLCRLDHRE